MATAIHHGPPGSFKSFTLVQRFAIDALKEGRVVITNIRGLTSIDRIQDQFPDTKFPDSADLWFINSDTEEGRQWMAHWFHWVPMRALIIIDECQRIYPNRRDFRKENLDRPIVPPGFEIDALAVEINDEYTGQRYTVHRPNNVDDAFDMQRHFQWDVYLSTPNISKVKDFIREVAHTAYRHKALAGKLPPALSKLFGLHNAWYEFQHDAENNGKLTSHIVGKPRKYVADERIFRCYQSTATGEHTDNKADQNILGDPKVKFLLFVIVLAFAGFIYSAISFYQLHFSDKEPASTVAPAASPDRALAAVVPAKNPSSVAFNAAGNVSNQQSNTLFDRLGYRLIQVSHQDTTDTDNRHLSFIADSKDGLKPVSYQELFLAGIRASIHGLCNIKLIAPDGSTLDLGCYSPSVRICSASADTPTLAIRRNCAKYGEPKEPIKMPQNALVATASKVLPSSD